MEQKKVGKFDLIENGFGDRKNLVICFHGYGADFRDLAPLSQELKLKNNTYWVFPNGPKSVPIGPGFFGRAWFHIDMRALEEAMMRGAHRDLSQWKPEPGNLIEDLKVVFDEIVPQYDKVIVGGFSQGAMLACDLVLSGVVDADGLFLLSGNMVQSDVWLPKMKACKKLPVFQSHGRQDQVLGFQYAELLKDNLEENDFAVEFYDFNGGHEIPLNILKKLESWINNNIK